MPSAYKDPASQRAVRARCAETLARADLALTTATIETSVGEVRLTSAGRGSPQVILVPGTAPTPP